MLKRLIILIALLVILAIQDNRLVRANSNHFDANLSAVQNDLSINEIYTMRGKMLAGLEHPKPKREGIQPQKTQVHVASQTVYKPKSISLAPEQIQALINKYAVQYGADAGVMTIIAKCESGFRADAVSPSGAFHGMYQFVPSTWQSNRKAMGLDDDLDLMYNAEEAIRTAAFKMGRDGYGAWPVCSQKAFSVLALR